jgi:hypothetical protein
MSAWHKCEKLSNGFFSLVTRVAGELGCNTAEVPLVTEFEF